VWGAGWGRRDGKGNELFLVRFLTYLCARIALPLTTEVGTKSVSNVGQRACVCGKGCRGGSQLRSRLLFRGRMGGSCFGGVSSGVGREEDRNKGGEIWRMDGHNHQPRSNPHHGWGESTNTVQRHGHPGRMLFIVRFFLSPLFPFGPFL
jgi:hypothetical protein